jgi:hypothetical protein
MGRRKPMLSELNSAKIPPLIALTFSLLGGILLSATKYLVIDFPVRFFRCLAELRFFRETIKEKGSRSALRCDVMSKALDEVGKAFAFVAELVDRDEPLTQEDKGIALTHLGTLKEYAGTIKGMANDTVVLVPFKETADSIHRACLAACVLLSAVWQETTDYASMKRLQESHDLNAAISESFQLLQDLDRSASLSQLELTRQMEGMKADRLGLLCKAALALAVFLILAISFLRWIRAFVS